MTDPNFVLEKPVWTDSDFAKMGWHDSCIHAMAFRAELFELWLDIDYILRWVHPRDKETHVCDLKFDIQSEAGELSIQDLKRSPGIVEQTDWRWLLNCHEGPVTFRSAGFSQFIRRPPILAQAQQSLETRGGISFARGFAA